MNLLPFFLLAIAPYAVAVVLCACLFALHSRATRMRVGGRDDHVSHSRPPFTIVMCVADADARACAMNLASITHFLGHEDRVIIVADHVSGPSLSALRDVVVADSRLSLKENSRQRGKKQAQLIGVEAAETEAIVAIDADCVIGRHFAERVRNEIAGCGIGGYMLLLPVEMVGGGGLFGRLEEIEFGCLQVVTAGTAFMGRPSMANGAGMVFPRSVFLGHDAKNEYASGDDMFLLEHTIGTGGEVRYVCDREALVTTAAPPSVSAYLRQRTRWLAKAGGFTSANVIVLALIVFVAVMAWPAAAAVAALGGMTWSGAAVVFVVKLTVDAAACGSWLFFRLGARGMKRLWAALPLELAYPVMTLTVALRAIAAPRDRW